MGLIQELANRNDVAMTVAAAIEHVLDGDIILAVGLPRTEPPNLDVLPAGNVRVVSAPFTAGIGGAMSIAIGETMARALEASATDESLLTAAGSAVEAGAQQVANIAEDEIRAG